MDIVKIGVIAILAALSAVVVKKQVQELGLVLALAAGVLLLSLSLEALEGVRAFLDLLAETAGLSPAILSPVLKTMGIAIVTKLSAELCRDAKEGGIAAFVETAGAAMALFVSLPLLRTVLSMITELL
jgi:stage III sporulation protein AD